MGTKRSFEMGRVILHLESNRYSDEALSKLDSMSALTKLSFDTQDEFQKYIDENSFDTIFTRLGLNIDEKIIEASPDLKYIVTSTTGLNHINIDVAAKRGIHVVSLKGETEFLNSIKSTAEHTWAILLVLIRKLDLAIADVKNGYWRRAPFLSTELDQKTIGIIGYGRLGKIVAKYAEVFDMKVLINDIDPNAYGKSSYENTPLDILLEQSDIVSIHIPSNQENLKFFNKELIEKAKKGFILINTSRGEVVNEADILEGLVSKQISGVATDVLYGDSTWENRSTADHPMVAYANQNTNLIITPHMGGYAYESIIRTRDFITNKYLNIIS